MVQEKKKKILAITACPTGVAHTYIAQEKLELGAKQLDYDIKVETHGSIGVKNEFNELDLKEADLIILAITGGASELKLERFANKPLYQVEIKKVIKDPKNVITEAFAKAKVYQTKKVTDDLKVTTNKKSWITHIMTGVSYMIPFIVFAGLTFAIVTGIGKLIWGNWLDYSGVWDYKTVSYTQGHETIYGWGIGAMFLLNKFANYGFLVMMPFMGAYIANAIAGRSAIAPAFVLTMLANDPDLWLHYSIFGDYAKYMKGMSIFGALIFGFAVGHTVKWINTKWRIHKYIQPIMPIIIIPVFVSLIYGAIWMFLIGNIFGLGIGYLYNGLHTLEESGIGMPLIGLVLGLIAGIDMGGPINKIASFSATALIPIDGGKSMGAAAAAFAIAPLGAGLTSLIFRNKFKEDKEIGINAVMLGFMGVSEGAIPFAAKYTWAAITPNIIGSGIAGMCAGLFGAAGHIGAWGGPIIAIFGGVTNYSGSFIGILWYLLAIAIGVIAHIIIFRILIELQSNGKLTKKDFKNIFNFKKSKKENKQTTLKKEIKINKNKKQLANSCFF